MVEHPLDIGMVKMDLEVDQFLMLSFLRVTVIIVSPQSIAVVKVVYIYSERERET